MIWKFKESQDIKKFANYISSELIMQGKKELASEVNQFSNTFYTTSSEYLGEFRILLNKIILQENIAFDEDTNKSIANAIESINKAFGNML